MEVKEETMHWHVVYTMPKLERKVASAIAEMGIESYLPLHKVVRQWSDRKKKLLLPLFPNYVFVKVSPEKRGYLYSIRELVRFVSIEKKPVIVREKEIDTIRKVLSGDVEVSPEEYFQEGAQVRVAYGQFAGLEGVMVKRSNDARLVIKVDGLTRAFSISIPAKFCGNLSLPSTDQSVESKYAAMECVAV